MTTQTQEQARDAFIEAVGDPSRGWEFPGLVRDEAYDEAVALDMAAHKLLMAVEEFKSAINSLDHVGKIVSTPEELVNLIIDYDQDEVGHKASDVLRAAIAEPAFLRVAAEVTGDGK